MSIGHIDGASHDERVGLLVEVVMDDQAGTKHKGQRNNTDMSQQAQQQFSFVSIRKNSRIFHVIKGKAMNLGISHLPFKPDIGEYRKKTYASG
ncbi:MAG: hypothetical protein D6814_02475 [Calditrichaeota bacterium]|nr:MAG: hypothetical protein D6814_02475 [Calditrichota bacterium]